MQKKVIISALDWGLGHATRMIPIVQYFIANKWKVILASSGEAAALWRQHFTDIEVVDLPAYDFLYSHNSMLTNVIMQLPKLKNAISKEHKVIEQLVASHKPSLIISDNRYGVYHPDVYSVFVTHQLQILPPSSMSFTKDILRKMHELFIRKFDQVWVPDFEGDNNLSGILSHGFDTGLNVKYIGPLSRFCFAESKGYKVGELPNVLALISGPEPNRTAFETIIIEQFKKYRGSSTILRGKPSENSIEPIDGVEIFNHLPDDKLIEVISKADIIIARSGYSTIMDLFYLKKHAIFVPTPGQTEQEYLAHRFMSENMFLNMQESNFDLQRAIMEYDKYLGFGVTDNHEFDLSKTLDSIVGVIEYI